jgi:GT2 family glycosyltransferase
VGHGAESASPNPVRPRAHGKFLFAGDEKLYVRGVSYGTFRDRADGPYPSIRQVAADFELMQAAGVNVVRTYTVPPPWLLDLAAEMSLRVFPCVPWEQHVAFLDDRVLRRSITSHVDQAAKSLAGHPGLLCLALGNEIPASIVRWLGPQRIERFLRELYETAKDADPAGLVTYANYPSTEYLELPFLDVVAFNVFLESDGAFSAYLARLQTLAGDRPLIITELGLDSRRNGEHVQAAKLERQVTESFAAGCAGTVVFSWTDEWHRDGRDIEDWEFGLTTRMREPKVALGAVAGAYRDASGHGNRFWPPVTVVVCSHNGSATIGECLDGIRGLDYPSVETIVVDDGSADSTAAIARAAGATVITTPNRGLSSARNTGLSTASGEVVAYIDDDATPDPHWLRYAVATLLETSHACCGGPNIPPGGQGVVGDAVAEAPGGPIHVLLSDSVAEHLPGCNMVFWRQRLVEVGGFDPQFRIAGDDVDICWRLQQRGLTLGYSPGAVVWHRRRETVRSYLRQQREYGKAEALLERVWPEKYNRTGHLSWAGRIYGGASQTRRGRIWYGANGTGLFQSLYERRPRSLGALPAMPEWLLLLAVLGASSVYELLGQPLLLDVPVTFFLFLATLGAFLMRAAVAGARVPGSLRVRALTAALHALQPAARLWGRAHSGLTPWRRRARRFAWPRARLAGVWSERWADTDTRVARIATVARREATSVLPGGPFDRWDLQVRTGALGAARVRFAVEEHGHGNQLVRARVWPVWSRGGIALSGVAACFAVSAAIGGALVSAGMLFGAAAVVLAAMVRECGAAVAVGNWAATTGCNVPTPVEADPELAEVLFERVREPETVHVPAEGYA